MNKLLYAAFAAAAVVGMTACSSEEPIPGQGDGSGNVTFVAKLPEGLATRAISDGTSATQLKYYVYEQGSTTPVVTVEDAEINISTAVNISLVNGQKYDIVFWAQSPKAEGIYTYNPTDRTITVSYDGVVQNDESRDAFYCAKTFTVTGGKIETAQLERPFAQINFGTSDSEEPVVESVYGKALANLTSSLTVRTEVPNVIDLMTGDVSGSTKVTFAAAKAPAATEPFPAGAASSSPIFEGCKYVAMDYLLCGKESTTVDLQLQIFANDVRKRTLTVNNAPVKANYQTNIYGRLLSTTQSFNVEILPAFGGVAGNIPENVKAWDGTVTEPEYDATAKTMTISSGAELAGLAKLVNEGNTFAGYTVTLAADINLGGLDWTPIGPNSDAPQKFQGVFDGKGHTISNLSVVKADVYESAGLFGSLNGTVRNLNIDAASISLKSSGDNSDNGAGAVAGAIYNTGLIENCTVTNSEIVCNRYGGGIAGYMYGSVIGCTVTNSKISGTLGNNLTLNDKIGGIAGYVGEGNSKIQNNTVEKCTMFGARNIGGIAGCTQSGAAVTGNKVSDSFVYFVTGNTNADSGSYSNGPIVGRIIGSTLSDNDAINVTVSKKP